MFYEQSIWRHVSTHSQVSAGSWLDSLAKLSASNDDEGIGPSDQDISNQKPGTNLPQTLVRVPFEVQRDNVRKEGQWDDSIVLVEVTAEVAIFILSQLPSQWLMPVWTRTRQSSRSIDRTYQSIGQKVASFLLCPLFRKNSSGKRGAELLISCTWIRFYIFFSQKEHASETRLSKARIFA